MRRKTLAEPATFAGSGLHTGADVTLRACPAQPGTGVRFIRADLPDRPEVEAVVGNVAARPMRTVLVSGRAEVHTVEHFMASAWALGLTDLLVEVQGPEVPGMDGSALPFFEGLSAAGVIEHGDREALELIVSQPLSVQEGNVSIVALPQDEGLTLSYTLTARNETQYLSTVLTEAVFASDLAPARTWILEEEVASALERGLGRGATYENTLVVGEKGIVRNTLRFPDELVRHKVLDLVGDLALMGASLHANVIAVRSGHQANRDLTQRLRELLLEELREREREAGIRPGVEMDVRALMEGMPHRYPFLLVDRVIEIDGNRRAVGLKNVTANEEFFQGHFPGQPIMPGVLQVEAMAQLAGALLIRSAGGKDKVPYLMSLDGVKFRRAVVPGDQLVLEAEALSLRADRAKVRTRASVDGKVVSEAVILFMLVDRG